MSYRKRTKPKFKKGEIVKYKGKLYMVVGAVGVVSRTNLSPPYLYSLSGEREKHLVREELIKKATQYESDKFRLMRFANA